MSAKWVSESLYECAQHYIQINMNYENGMQVWHVWKQFIRRIVFIYLFHSIFYGFCVCIETSRIPPLGTATPTDSYGALHFSLLCFCCSQNHICKQFKISRKNEEADIKRKIVAETLLIGIPIRSLSVANSLQIKSVVCISWNISPSLRPSTSGHFPSNALCHFEWKNHSKNIILRNNFRQSTTISKMCSIWTDEKRNIPCSTIFTYTKKKTIDI